MGVAKKLGGLLLGAAIKAALPKSNDKRVVRKPKPPKKGGGRHR